MTSILLSSQSRQVFHYQIQATELHTCWRRRGGHSGFMGDCCLLGNCGCLLAYHPSHLHNVINGETGVRGSVWPCLVLCTDLFTFSLLILTTAELITAFIIITIIIILYIIYNYNYNRAFIIIIQVYF
jgi:hypothetical protein